MQMSESKQCKALWFIYMIETEDNTLYTGISNDVAKRWLAHKQGSGAKYLKAHKPKALVYVEASSNRSEASKREAALKKLSRAAKLLLISNGQALTAKLIASYQLSDS